MASVNLQLIAVLNQDVQHVLNLSHERWLNAEELQILFQNLALLPQSTYTFDEPGLYRVQTLKFADDHAWTLFPNGNLVIGGRVVHGGLTFNYTFAQSPDLQRRTIRRQQLYVTFTFSIKFKFVREQYVCSLRGGLALSRVLYYFRCLLIEIEKDLLWAMARLPGTEPLLFFLGLSAREYLKIDPSSATLGSSEQLDFPKNDLR
ncbi:hypothetical protein IGI04_039308 [Brassica rapa subsp. trilocularis]|uniref:Uncharacterized protein n=1 Tax=Brassica rapa subsp. trilocularis TaxID=1813537 RepID=A0ABQ7KL97_BRACM|nr:hypothetical protein IGI04_039308 [Brassica rapa subsp. trilocularis]